MDTLSIVEFGNNDSLGEFLFENGMQHKLFHLQYKEINMSIILDGTTGSGANTIITFTGSTGSYTA